MSIPEGKRKNRQKKAPQPGWVRRSKKKGSNPLRVMIVIGSKDHLKSKSGSERRRLTSKRAPSQRHEDRPVS